MGRTRCSRMPRIIYSFLFNSKNRNPRHDTDYWCSLYSPFIIRIPRWRPTLIFGILSAFSPSQPQWVYYQSHSWWPEFTQIRIIVPLTQRAKTGWPEFFQTAYRIMKRNSKNPRSQSHPFDRRKNQWCQINSQEIFELYVNHGGDYQKDICIICQGNVGHAAWTYNNLKNHLNRWN